MKYLQDYMTDRQTEAFNKAGAFFAFGNAQFEEQRKEGVKYVIGPCGLICPKETYAELSNELNTIYEESIKQDIAENGLNAIVKRELNNHEAYYTRDLETTISALQDYPIKAEDIKAVFNNQNHIIK